MTSQLAGIHATTPVSSDIALLKQAKSALYQAINVLMCVKIENDYQAKAYQDALDAYHALAAVIR